MRSNPIIDVTVRWTYIRDDALIERLIGGAHPRWAEPPRSALARGLFAPADPESEASDLHYWVGPRVPEGAEA